MVLLTVIKILRVIPQILNIKKTYYPTITQSNLRVIIRIKQKNSDRHLKKTKIPERA